MRLCVHVCVCEDVGKGGLVTWFWPVCPFDFYKYFVTNDPGGIDRYPIVREGKQWRKILY